MQNENESTDGGSLVLGGLNQRSAYARLNVGEVSDMHGVYPGQFGLLERIAGKRMLKKFSEGIVSIHQTFDSSNNIIIQTTNAVHMLTLDELLDRSSGTVSLIEVVLPAPLSLSVVTASTTVAVSWLSVPTAVKYRVYRSAISGGPFTFIAETDGLTYTNTGLTNNATYYYVVTSLDLNRESVFSVQISAIPSATGVPTNLVATPGDTTVDLTWTAVASATSYTVYRATSIGGSYTSVDTPASNSSSDTGRTNFVPYFYKVTATVATVESAASAIVSATPSNVATPSGLAATAGITTIALAWTTITSATYHVKRSAFTGGPYTTIASPATNSYTDTGLTAGVNYYYRVSAIISTIEGNNSTEVTSSPSLPGTPTSVAATNNIGNIAISWTAVSGATYKVKRSTTSGGPYTLVGSPSGTSYTDSTVVAGTTYYYVVSAVISTVEGLNSSQVSGVCTIPTAPTLWDCISSIGQTILQWSPSLGLTTPLPSGYNYNVKRADASGGPYTTIATPTLNNYVDAPLALGVTHYYVITASIASTESNPSAEGSATSIRGPAPGFLTGFRSGGSIVLQTKGSVYNIKRSLVESGPFTLIGISVITADYLDTPPAGHSYWYVVTYTFNGIESFNSPTLGFSI